MPPPFLDSSVLLRHLLQDHPQQSPRATRFLARVERGEIEVRTADTVIFETVVALQRQQNHSKATIAQVLLPLIELPGVLLPGKRRFRRIFDIYVNLKILFADAYYVALMEQEGLEEIVSFDQGLDQVPALRRMEP